MRERERERESIKRVDIENQQGHLLLRASNKIMRREKSLLQQRLHEREGKIALKEKTITPRVLLFQLVNNYKVKRLTLTGHHLVLSQLLFGREFHSSQH